MSDHSSRDTGGELPDAVVEAAVIWHARMRQPADATGDRRAAFEAWLADDPRHAEAYAEAEWLWRTVASPGPLAAGSSAGLSRTARAGVRRGLAGLAMAACVLLAVAAGWTWGDMVLDRIRSDHATGIGERAAIALADGSQLVLGSDTAVAVDMASGERRVRMFRGQAWFEVGTDRARPFVVTTDAGAIRVFGTRFDVRIDGDATVVSLAEGRVEVRGGIAGQAVALVPGQQARLSSAGVAPPHPFDDIAVSAWRRGQYVFYETPLSEVVAALNRNRLGRIVVVGEHLERLRVSGVFRSDDPDAVITAIEDALPVRARRLTDLLVLLQ